MPKVTQQVGGEAMTFISCWYKTAQGWVLWRVFRMLAASREGFTEQMAFDPGLEGRVKVHQR